MWVPLAKVGAVFAVSRKTNSVMSASGVNSIDSVPVTVCKVEATSKCSLMTGRLGSGATYALGHGGGDGADPDDGTEGLADGAEDRGSGAGVVVLLLLADSAELLSPLASTRSGDVQAAETRAAAASEASPACRRTTASGQPHDGPGFGENGLALKRCSQ